MSPASRGSGERDRVYAKDRSAWRRWLQRNGDRTAGVWLVYDKGPHRTLTYADIVEEALCFGWVDSLPRSLSATQAMLYVAPRKPSANWSKKNKERVAELRAAGRMTPAGEAVISAAQANGRWDALNDVEQLVEPDDLRLALDADLTVRRRGALSCRC